MRLVCPSCGAEYEVDDSVIPDAGRDVQCSNCGHAWFQASAAQLRAAASAETTAPETPEWTEETKGSEAESDPVEEAADDADTQSDEPETTEAETEDPTEPAASQPQSEPDIAAKTAEEPQSSGPTPETGDGATGPGPTPFIRRRTLDDAVLNVLREEAAREARVRNAQGATLETQPDLGLTSAAAAVIQATDTPKDRVARTRGNVPPEEDEDALMSRGSRRELLPDIEEINSTLRATSERDGEAASLDAPETLRRRRSGFRLGFSVSLISAAILLATYLLAPTIAETFPGLEKVMTRYVHGIDKTRLWIDEKMQSSTEALRGN
ncbi:MAG: zinc-ribbon domain-containing protein [Rhodobacteraceae bacterium]|nr:zinc-ribbon domain-containing protein [Paracoccaceae bacterium]